MDEHVLCHVPRPLSEREGVHAVACAFWTTWQVKTKPIVVSKREMRKRRKLLPAEPEAAELGGESTRVPAAKDESEESEGGPEDSSGSPQKVPQEDGDPDGDREDSSGSPQNVPQEDCGSQEGGVNEHDARSQTGEEREGQESSLREGGSSLQPAAEVEEEETAVVAEEAEEAEDRDQVPPEEGMSHPSPHPDTDPSPDPDPNGDQVPPAGEDKPAGPPELALPSGAAAGGHPLAAGGHPLAAGGAPAGDALAAGSALAAGGAPVGALTEEMVHQLGAAAWEAAFPALP